LKPSSVREIAERIAGSNTGYGWSKGCEMYVALADAIEEALRHQISKDAKIAFGELKEAKLDKQGSRNILLWNSACQKIQDKIKDQE